MKTFSSGFTLTREKRNENTFSFRSNDVKAKARRAFTIIETLIYLGLFSILIGGAVVGAFNIFQSAGREQTHAILQEDGNFIIGKIQWAVSGAQSVNQPGGGLSGSQLVVNKVTGLDANGQPVITTVTMTWVGNTDLQIQDGSVPVENLNGVNVKVTRLGFLHTLASGNGIDPESVTASTTLTALTPNGQTISEDFSTTVYVRR